MTNTTLVITLTDTDDLTKKTINIANPKAGLQATDAQDFVTGYNAAYGGNCEVLTMKYIDKTERVIYPTV